MEQQVIGLICEHVTREMKARTDFKFRQWDRILERDLLNTGSEEEKAAVYRLLDDPCVYAYAWFRNDDGTPWKMYPYQDTILNDKHDRIMFVAANQIGKSKALCFKAISEALKHPGWTIVMVSKTLPQSKDLLRDIKNILKNGVLDWEYDIGDTDSKTEIYFKHTDIVEIKQADGTVLYEEVELPQSRIICVPATEGALGYPVDLLLIDELAFYEDGEYIYEQILQPRTYHTKGQIIVFSNPNGQQGIFWKIWNSPRWHKYRFDFLDCPANTQEDFDKLASELPQERIESTLLAIFTKPMGGFLTPDERKAIQLLDRPNGLPAIITQPIFIFFDFAKSQDRTVRAIGNPFGNQEHPGVDCWELFEYPGGTGYDVILEDTIQLITAVGRQNVALVGWDNTGVGKGLEDFFRRIEGLGVMCMPVEFSLENKSRLYTIFKLLVERTTKGQDGLRVPFVTECDKQLAALRFQRSQRGYLQVHHEKEGDRDDFPDALAGLCSLIIQPDSAPVTVEIVEGDFEKVCDACGYKFKEDEQDDDECPECHEPYNDWLGVV